MSIIWHNHHIIPRHAGGTDDPSNILKCNIKMHSFMHEQRYKETGDEYDRIAWKALLGQMNNKDAIHSAQVENGKRRAKQLKNEGHFSSEKQSARAKKWNASEAGRDNTKQWLKAGGRTMAAILNARRIECNKCGMISTPGPMAGHFKVCGGKAKCV